VLEEKKTNPSRQTIPQNPILADRPGIENLPRGSHRQRHVEMRGEDLFVPPLTNFNVYPLQNVKLCLTSLRFLGVYCRLYKLKSLTYFQCFSHFGIDKTGLLPKLLKLQLLQEICMCLI
jgi:hypothetical protein